MDDNRLGEHLRARREQTSPESVGVQVNSKRRVQGLRRDELALLAGISTEYYTRLEQGRDRRPSAQVLDAVARALDMDAAATGHLHGLAERPRLRRPPRRTERVRPGLAELLGGLHQPAYVEGRYLDILYANPLARALSPLFTPGTNILRATLLTDLGIPKPVVTEAVIRSMVAQLRGSAGADLDDPRLTELVGELSLKSDEFRRLWPEHDVRAPPSYGTSIIPHPMVGEIELMYEKLRIVGAEDQLVVVCRAGSYEAADALSLLAATVQDRDHHGGSTRSSTATVGTAD